MTQSQKGTVIFVILLFAALFLAGTTTSADRTVSIFGDSLAVINIVGTISTDDGYTYNQQYLLDAIDQCTYERNNQGILLYIDSPGGTVYEADEVYRRLLNYKAVTGNPVYASIGHYGASAAYYIACAADKIYANRNSTTGAIGVIMGSSIDLTELFDKLGVKMETFTAGSNKNMLGIDEPVTDEQRAIMQSILDEAYEQFINVIADGRQMTLEKIIPLADGRIYSAKQAEQHQLIDGIEDFEDTLARLLQKTHVDNRQVRYYGYEADDSLWDYLLGTALSAIGLKESQLSVFNQSAALPSGVLAYYPY